MHVLVTGGAGYIGSHVVRALRRAGHSVVVVDDLSTGHREFIAANDVPLVEGPVGDPGVLSRAFRAEAVDAVVHIAGKALAPESVRDPAPYFETNAVAGFVLLEAMRRFGVRRIVFSSTCATYGVPPDLPITEHTPQDPISPYGTSKLCFEFMLRAYRQAYGFQTLALRYFNVAGASEDASVGELHDPETHLIPNLLAAAWRGTPFSLFGTDYPTRDGTAIRDYLHVEDLARAHVLAIERLDQLDSDRDDVALNLGTGHGASVREMLDAVEAATGKKVLVKECPRREGDPPALVADAARARRVLGFETEHDLTSMVESAWRFMQAAAERSSDMAQTAEPPKRRLKFGELAVKAGYIRPEVVERALEIQRERDGVGDSHKLLGLILLEMGAISNDQLIETLQRMNGSQRLQAADE